MRERPDELPRAVPTRCGSWTVTAKPSSRRARAAERPSTPPPTTQAVLGSGLDQLAQLAALVQLRDDVAAADQLAVDEQLRDRRPARVGGQGLADARVGQDVDGAELRPGIAQAGHGLGREAAARHVGSALHEQHDAVLGDGIEDLLLDLLLTDDHCATSVLILSAWMGRPGPSRWATAELTRRCCSSSGMPANC